MSPHPGDLAMIITPEQAALKAQQSSSTPCGTSCSRPPTTDSGSTPSSGKSSGNCSASGHTLLSAFVAAQGDGDLGPETETAPGPHRATIARAPRPPLRVDLRRTDHRPGRLRHQRRPEDRAGAALDERLGLPEGDFSYVLEDWGQRLCLKESFAEAGHSLEMLLGLRAEDPGVGAHEPGGGGPRPGVPGGPAGPPGRGRKGR